MKTTSKVITSVLVVLLLVLLLAEFGIRAYSANQIKEEFPVANDEVEVSFGTVPMIFGLATGKLDQMHAHSPELSIEAEGIHLRGADEGMVENASATTDISNEELVAMFQQAIREEMPPNTPDLVTDNITITNIYTERGGNIEVEFVHGAYMLTLTPVVTDEGLRFEAPSSTLFGINLSDEVNANIEQAIAEAIEETAGADTLGLRNAEVLEDGVRITVGGQNVRQEDIPRPE